MHVMFICLGNICRSPMAERVARKLAEERGLDVRLTSAGTSAEEAGAPIDRRAQRLLRERGYDVEDHVARRIDQQLVEDVDLFVVAEDYHGDRLARLGVDRTKIRLITDYDPESEKGAPLPDPWYGDLDGFEATLGVLERAIPRLLDDVARGTRP